MRLSTLVSLAIIFAAFAVSNVTFRDANRVSVLNNTTSPNATAQVPSVIGCTSVGIADGNTTLVVPVEELVIIGCEGIGIVGDIPRVRGTYLSGTVANAIAGAEAKVDGVADVVGAAAAHVPGA